MEKYLLSIDQGTTNSRAILFNQHGEIKSQHEVGLNQFYPHDGWVEQDPEEIVKNTIHCCQETLKKSMLSASDIAAVGISNQRETSIIWDRITGKAIYPAIVWQDRRTHAICSQLSKTELAEMVPKKTGLVLDPYFSATKIMWLLDNVPDARARAMRGELLFGTVDTFLLWRLTKGKCHFTDITNAARTMLFNIHTLEWDMDIISRLNVPMRLLPKVLDNTADFGEMDEAILGKSIPIAGMAGDQQAATIGQACFDVGMVKVTYGTGCFMLLNTGSEVIHATSQLLSTVAYRIGNTLAYGLEGSIFSAGVVVKWLRDTLKLISCAAETETISRQLNSTEGVYLVPAFTGLGAPYWDPHARAAILGLTRSSNRDHIIRAGLESIAYQTRDLLEAMASHHQLIVDLRVDGGMVVNKWLLQFIADIVNIEVERPYCIESSALGVAFLAGLQVGIFASLDEIAKKWKRGARFIPSMEEKQRQQSYAGWQRSVKSVLRQE